VIQRLTLALVVALAAWISLVAVRIELLNAEAGYYLPGRHGDTIGKWRVSADDSQRDRLRAMVSGYGIWQYPLTLMLGIFSIFFWFRNASMVWRYTAVCTGLVSIAALGLAIYREYFPSLGW
jgi:hypothetical protein